MTLRFPLIAAVLLFSATGAQAKGPDQKDASTRPHACSCQHDMHTAPTAPPTSAKQSPKGMTPEDLEYLRNSP